MSTSRNALGKGKHVDNSELCYYIIAKPQYFSNGLLFLILSSDLDMLYAIY